MGFSNWVNGCLKFKIKENSLNKKAVFAIEQQNMGLRDVVAENYHGLKSRK